MKSLLDNHNLILMEAAVVERLRRARQVNLHPDIVHAHLIYDDQGKKALEMLYQSYIAIAVKAKLPILLITPTWRANYDRVMRSGINPDVNADAVRFMCDIRTAQGLDAPMIRIGGIIGCKNDCYLPEQGLSVSEAVNFHSWQIDQLAGAGVDFLMATTLPNVNEALGIAKAMEKTVTPYILSFVIGRDGSVLDGTSLWEAVTRIDSQTNQQPLCYMVNCAYPTFLHADEQPAELFSRLFGFQGNSSSLSHSELDGSSQLQAEPVDEWTNEMMLLKKKYGLKILGGCCGTDESHLQSLVDTLTS
jgi:S-methylmethionine-dependent homocysteine/selenocysteine methylase